MPFGEQMKISDRIGTQLQQIAQQRFSKLSPAKKAEVVLEATGTSKLMKEKDPLLFKSLVEQAASGAPIGNILDSARGFAEGLAPEEKTRVVFNATRFAEKSGHKPIDLNLARQAPKEVVVPQHVELQRKNLRAAINRLNSELEFMNRVMGKAESYGTSPVTMTPKKRMELNNYGLKRTLSPTEKARLNQLAKQKGARKLDYKGLENMVRNTQKRRDQLDARREALLRKV